MQVLVTGSAGHLGEALMRELPRMGFGARGLDLLPSPFTGVVGSMTDVTTVERAMDGVDAVIHAATLHKPHVATHPEQAFIDVNIAGTQTLLDAAVGAGVRAFVFTSSTTAFGRSLAGDGAAAWIDEQVPDRPKNIYGVTKCAAEDLCELTHRTHALPVVVLRTARFFPEADDLPERAAAFDDANLKVVELLHRRLDLADAVTAHTAALSAAPRLGFAKLVISATTPLRREDAAALGRDAHGVVLGRCDPRTAELFADRGWRLPATLDRVYDNARARAMLSWEPVFTFDHAIERLAAGESAFSELTAEVGSKSYHRGAHPKT